MADQKIELEIVLDDGSIKKAFATIKDEAKKAGDETSSFFGGMGSFGSSVLVLNQGIELFGKMAGAIKSAANEMIALSLEAEKVRVTQAQFIQLTEQAGIATEQFEASIRKSIAGLVDDDSALQIANEAIVRIGLSAQRLPQIFELARKASASGFGDMTQNAEALVNAIQTGQTRQLRSIGVLVDLTKAQKDFARSIGLTAEQLTEGQKAYVNANAILDATSKKFQKVDGDIKTFSDSLKRFKVANDEAFERFAIQFDKAFGPTVRAILDTLTESLNGNGTALKAAAVDASKVAGEVQKLEASIKLINERLLNARTDTQFNVYNRQLVQANELLIELKKRQAELDAPNKGDDLIAKNILKYQEFKEVLKKNDEQRKQESKNRLDEQIKFSNQMEQFQQQEISARQNNLQFIEDDNLRKQESEAIHQEQLRLIVEKGINDRKMIEDTYSNEKGFNEEQRRMLEAQQIEAQNAQIIAMQNEFQEKSLDSFDQQAKRRQQQFKNFSVVAKTFFFDVVSQGFQAIGAALVNGENAFQSFGKVFLGILGDIVIALGNSFIAAGIANSFIPLFGFGGVGAIGAGAALVVLGGALKALSGGAGSSSFSQSPGAGNQGGGNFSDTNNFNPANPVAAERVQPNTVVNFTIQGDVFDSDATQDRIVKLINDGVDTKGLVLRGNG